MTEFITLNDETIGYLGKVVLQGISLKINVGERVALVGESGAGKSTLLRTIYERQNAESALIPQDLGLVHALSVFHNVYMGRLHLRSVWRNLRNLLRPATAELKAVRDVLTRLRLEDELRSLVGELSGGQQQRTAVGRALYHPGDALIADEPVSAVDEHQAHDILRHIQESKDTTILAMHDRALAIRYSDRLIGVKDGRIALDEPAAGMQPSDLDDLYQTA
ncbi:MAG: ATP-binding cassette domain-containing protein [Rhodospirillales bacterium]